eukprot:scaffold456159_cov20-Prasinocladus_malaysianus.AAC.1
MAAASFSYLSINIYTDLIDLINGWNQCRFDCRIRLIGMHAALRVEAEQCDNRRLATLMINDRGTRHRPADGHLISLRL